MHLISAKSKVRALVWGGSGSRAARRPLGPALPHAAAVGNWQERMHNHPWPALGVCPQQVTAGIGSRVRIIDACICSVKECEGLSSTMLSQQIPPN